MRTLFRNVWVVPVDGVTDVIEKGCVLVENDRIAYVGENEPENANADRVIDGRGKKLVMPGFVNGHTHLPMVLFRGSAEDMPLQNWLNERIFPMEALLEPDSVHIGTLLALMELVQNGVTCVNDMYTQNRAMIRALDMIPLRATLSMGLFGVAPNWREQIADNVDFFKTYNGRDAGRIRVALVPHAEYTATEEFLTEVAQTAKELGCPIHIHVSETKLEHEECKGRHGGLTPVQLLRKLGILDVPATLAHCVWLEDEDLDIVKATGASVLHNPCSNMKLASGFARVPEMVKRGIPVALSTDGASSNNSLDIWEEMRLCAIMHKGHTLDATALRARDALYMATRGAALALGYADVGGLEVGNKADMILVDIDRPYYNPMTDLIHHIVYGGNARDVELTMVNGRILYEKGKPFGFDVNEVYERAQWFYDNVFAKA